MLAFAGSIDMPGLAMVFGPLLLVLAANGFSWRRFLVVSNQIVLDIGVLFLVIASAGLLANQEDLFAFHLMASMALLTVVFALILKLPLQLLSGEVGTYADTAHWGFKVVAILLFVVGVYFAELYAADVSTFIDGFALIYVSFSILVVVGLNKLSGKGDSLRALSRYLPSIGLVGVIIGAVTGLQDIYELASMTSLLMFGVLSLQYVLYLRIILFLAVPEEVLLASNQQPDVLTTICSVALIGVVFYMVFVSTALV